MAGISVWQLAIILVIVMLLFGTKKFRTIGTDLGGAIRGFKKAVNDEGSDALEHQVSPSKEVNKENKINH